MRPLIATINRDALPVAVARRSLACKAQAPHPKSEELPASLVRARKLRQIGLSASTACLAAASVIVASQQLTLPALSILATENISHVAIPAVIAAVVSLLVVCGKKLQDDTMMIEVHNGRVYIQLDVPPRNGPVVDPGSVTVQPSKGKGNGAFATEQIQQGAYIGDYEGEYLDEAAYWQRYPAGVADYCIGIDQEWTIDGRDRAEDTSTFSPCHMNHSYKWHNVARRCNRAERKVSFYAERNIEEGEELLLDYGALYWQGREEQRLD